MLFVLSIITVFLSVVQITAAPPEFGMAEAKRLLNDRSVNWELGSKNSEIFVYISEGNKKLPYRIESISRFFDIMNGLQPLRWYTVGNRSLKISFSGAWYDSSVIYDIRSKYLELDSNKLECGYDGQFTKNPLSLVGGIFSYESVDVGIEACGPHGISHHITSIDLTSGKKVSLPCLVDSQSIVTAIKADGWIRKREYSESDDEYDTYIRSLENISDLHTLYNVLAARKSLTAWYGERFDSFAFISFDGEKKLLGVRLLLYKEINANASKKIQLGLMLKPNNMFMSRILNNGKIDRKNTLFIGAFNNSLQ